MYALSQLRPANLKLLRSSRQEPKSANACLRNEQFALAILNGGMATRFGGIPKGTVSIDGDISFLGAKLLDAKKACEALGVREPLCFLMCSSATLEPTAAHLRSHGFFGFAENRLVLFSQCESVRFLPNGEIYLTSDGSPSFHGTGHGDLASCVRKLPEFVKFSATGRALLLSNVDNVLANVSLSLLDGFLDSGVEMLVELVDKNPGDVGGAPLEVDGRTQLVEAFRIPDGFDHSSVGMFNTNTFWIKPNTLMNSDFSLPWHRVSKKVDGKEVIQFERLIGELTLHVPAQFARVDREGEASRFIPVKTPDDLERSKDVIIKTWSKRCEEYVK